jgi:hypothetical protein
MLAKLGTWKILALIKAKKDEHVLALDKVDARDNLTTTITKWKNISLQ